MSIRVLVVDDEDIVRDGVGLLLSGEPDLEIVGECSDGRSALAKIVRLRPDVALIDVRMPGMDGIETTAAIRAELGTAAPAIVMLTSFDVDEAVWDSLGAGAAGFVLKSQTASDLVRAIRSVAAGEVALEPRIVRLLVDRYGRDYASASQEPPEVGRLTPKEREVLLLAAEGLSNYELAERLTVEVGTIKTHISHILTKLGVRDRAQAIAFAYRHELVRRNG
ncbi:response regulator transcription factor [Kribbella pittospori]|uniref:Response regulator transcription factor n=1 Tax=Kribbella pittospori TaxID=722689 RepID=A0A4V2M8H6_9ACTN|nr:response regulator transcription factor [Kribbella pittospori]TCC51512.1 response regulator transcription factor [Kribbella pittospori]